LALTDGAVWTVALLAADGIEYPERKEDQSDHDLIGLSGARLKASINVANFGQQRNIYEPGTSSSETRNDGACAFQLEVSCFP